MRNRRLGGSGAVALTLALAVATVGIAWAQDPATAKAPAKVQEKDKEKDKAAKGSPKVKTKKGGLLAPGGPKGKEVGKADPLARPVEAAPPAPGTFHYALKIVVAEGTALAATYYPSRLGTGAPVVMLVHERDRSSKDFEDKVADLQNQGLAEGLQKDGFAVLTLDLRGHGANPRRAVSARDWPLMVGDLQAAYTFLIDRHNRGELNLSRLGVVALGEGANVVAVWASLPGGAVSSQGRTSDLGAIVLVSPMIDAQSQGLRALQPLVALAPRVPLCVLAGERDHASADLVKAARPSIVRVPANKVEMFPSSLHGFKLLRLEPNVAGGITRFLDGTIKAKAEEWEPRYNLEPVPYSDVQVVVHQKKADELK
jgi:alpha-beta hydrolase superfamily lysophospholipase